MKICFTLCCLPFFWLWTGPVCGQDFLNGDFENHRFDCGINLINSVFSSGVPHAVAYGSQGEIDVLTDDCGYGSAASGDYFLALYVNGSSDELSMELSEPLKVGGRYTLRFWDRVGDNRFGDAARVEIGLSETPDAFGDLLFSAPAANVAWRERTFTFRAPYARTFVTVRIVSEGENWIFVDGFALICPEIDLGSDTTYCKVANIPLRLQEEFDEYRWSDGTTNSSTVADAPGTYWVEVFDGGKCRLRDTIVLDEVERNCECSVFVPNAFSPNDDGVNERLLPLTPCALLDYSFLIFDRWGQLIFESEDPQESWDGDFRGRPAPLGVYLYALTFRFEFEEQAERRVGTVSLMR